MSLYDDLGVPRDASPEDIKAAHRRAAKRHHPDKGGDRAEFDRIQRAALILRDPEKRTRYDRDGTVDDQPDRSRSAAAEVLVTAFHETLRGGANLAGLDLIANIRGAIIRRRRGDEQQQHEVIQALKRIAEAIERLSHKGKGENLLGALLGQQQREGEAALAQLEQQIAACIEACDMAGDYDWRFDPAAPFDPDDFDIITIGEMEEMPKRAGRDRPPFGKGSFV